jgi:hypothetical protein
MTPAERNPAQPEESSVAIDPKDLEKFVGVYPLPKISQDLRIVLKSGKLKVVGNTFELELRPLGPAHFSLNELSADIVFLPKADGGMSVKVTQGSQVNEGDRVAPWDATSADLLPYTGTYWSEELETQYTFFVRDGKLLALHSHHGEFELTPTFRDHFSSSQWFAPNVHFIRDATGTIGSVILGGGRVSGVTFARKTKDLH